MAKVYVRFGDIPTDGKSKVYKSGEVVKEELGVSVWNCAFANGVPYPILLTNFISETALADYISHLFGNRKVYLVTGDVVGTGTVGEPLLNNVTVIREYTDDYEYLKGILRR